MPYLVKSGAKAIGKAKTKRGVSKILAKEYRRENRVSVLRISKKRRRKRRK